MSGRMADRVRRCIVDGDVARGLLWSVVIKVLMESFAAAFEAGKQTPIRSIIETLIIETWGDRGVNCVITKHLLNEQYCSIVFDLD